jgi:hypothetical protein
MPFQTVIASQIPAGIVGELAFEGPLRAQPYNLVSADAANNVIGRACTVTSEGVAAVGGSGQFAGILANPKIYTAEGTQAGGALAQDNVLANNTIVECVTMGEIWVLLPGAAAIGDAVKYNTTTGILGSGAPGAGELAVPGAKVSHYTVSGAGIACITLTN